MIVFCWNVVKENNIKSENIKELRDEGVCMDNFVNAKVTKYRGMSNGGEKDRKPESKLIIE